MQAELDAIWDKLLPALQAKTLPPDVAEAEKVKKLIANLEVRPTKKPN
jgi:hypothetical protein